jgi:hypothetical protein
MTSEDASSTGRLVWSGVELANEITLKGINVHTIIQLTKLHFGNHFLYFTVRLRGSRFF